MTDDLLGKIFYHLCETGPLSLRHLLFVSRRFYYAAVNNAHLWTTIYFDSLFAHHFHQWREQGDIFIEQCLLRSGSLPLCLSIDDTDPYEYGLTVFHHPLETFGKPEWRGLQRCTSMILKNRPLTASRVAHIVALLPKSLPSLQYISLSNFSDPTDGSQFPNCPMLERVEMFDYGQPSPPFWGTNLLKVTTLSFGNITNWMAYDITDTLSQFPMLHDLTLSTESGRGYLVIDSPQLPINFNRLRILRAHGYIPPDVVAKLVAPALKDLHIKANVEHITPIDALQHLSEPHCQYIHALLPKGVSAMEPEWATNLSNLVQKCTRIKSLYISKWMEKKCKKFLRGRDDVILHVQ